MYPVTVKEGRRHCGTALIQKEVFNMLILNTLGLLSSDKALVILFTQSKCNEVAFTKFFLLPIGFPQPRSQLR